MFNDEWLNDPEFFWVSEVPDDNIAAYCKLCKKEISVSRGKSALRAHAKGKKHSELSQQRNGYKTAVQPVNPTYDLSCMNNCSASTSTGKRCKTLQPKKMLCVSSSAKATQHKHVNIRENVFLEHIRYGDKSSISRFQRSLEYSSGSEKGAKYLEDMYSFGKKEKKREEKRKEKKKKKDCSSDDSSEEEDDDDDDLLDKSDESDESDDMSTLIAKMIANKVFFPRPEKRGVFWTEKGDAARGGQEEEERGEISMGNEQIQGTNTVSVPIAWATFGGSTCLLFLLCYLCQKKLQDQEIDMEHTPQQVYVISAMPRTMPDEVCQQAPPDYESALRAKNYQRDAPPPYESAVSKDMSSYSLTL